MMVSSCNLSPSFPARISTLPATVVNKVSSPVPSANAAPGISRVKLLRMDWIAAFPASVRDGMAGKSDGREK